MKRFFYLQDSDRSVFAVLLIVAVLVVTILAAVGRGGVFTDAAPSDSIRKNTAVRYQNPRQPYVYGGYADGTRTAELFMFDPNTADSTALLRLGLPPRLVRNIYKYRAKGGTYSRPEDFARMYGLTAGQYKALAPYIRISADYLPAADTYGAAAENITPRDTLRYPLKLKQGETIPLNTADTALLKRVPGIGGTFARAAVNYRERLGGYYSPSQLLEINGFPPSALPYMRIDKPPFRRLCINKLTLNELSRHPYIGFYQAKTITEHRRIHGRINGWSDLSMYRDFTPEVISRLTPYVEF